MPDTFGSRLDGGREQVVHHRSDGAEIVSHFTRDSSSRLAPENDIHDRR